MASASALNRFQKTHGDALTFIPHSTNFTWDSYRAHRCRFALVYGVAAMDSYFTKKFTDNLTVFLKAKGVTEDLENKLKRAGINTKFFLELLRAEDFSTNRNTRPFKKIHSKIRVSLGKYTSQSTDRIDDLFKAYEITNLSQNAIQKGKTDGLFKDVRKPDVKLNGIVKRRHQIVHTNDYNMRGAYNKIESKRTRKDLEIIEAFVCSADSIIDNKFATL